ncbi:uncharacterized protein F5Z01DRAFT_201089 [Emericellopsis atlantica]|uniref:Condensation domain-containing protein n=1 Tax=Emericellopsis atlantica TaxID=2614577 RepID=A0A9P7ZVJ4_9HYPO|nr:uncharacterized protein F5Z01DRAFT_201089 [Emericellopsis atlantica]KAG9258527.1 hypothetical protein F5Z01DRAFT_201089 [Emericellopsis atlantica]
MDHVSVREDRNCDSISALKHMCKRLIFPTSKTLIDYLRQQSEFMLNMATRPVFHPWNKSQTIHGSDVISRPLATGEFVLAMLNEHAQGHNCPYLGAKVSIEHLDETCTTVDELKSSVQQAFAATRWCHPTVAAQVHNGKELVYPVEDANQVSQWLERTVHLVQSSEGWIGQHDKLSRDVVLPTATGDYALLYLIVHPDQVAIDNIVSFDLLLHVHHTLVDGAGLRTLLNLILQSLVKPTSESYHWGEETQRLAPSALDAAIISDEVVEQLNNMPKEIPLPPLGGNATSRHGTGVVMHTFEKDNFLQSLKYIARKHGVKLTGIVQAALLQTVYSKAQPCEEDALTVISGYDLRARNLQKPWSDRNQFVGAAVGLEMMKLPVTQLAADGSGKESLWSAAKHIQQNWASLAERKDVAAGAEMRRQATGFILQMAMAEVNKEPSKLGLSLNYVSDPPGSNQLDGTYQQNGRRTFKLEEYQLVTDESTPKLSCRSHSWKDQLTLEISFSYKHYTKEFVAGVLEAWAQQLVSRLQEEY